MDGIFKKLVSCHSTPGDEGEVRDVLESAWSAAGWESVRHGDYAVSARDPLDRSSKPVLLICAHMDSPGYSIDRMNRGLCGTPEKTRFGVTELGSPEFDGYSVPALLKTRRAKFRGALVRLPDKAGESDFCFEMDVGDAGCAEVRQGDRICFSPFYEAAASLLRSPFLDNRAGCWMLARLAAEVRAWQTNYRIVLGASASEEMGGFGARVLAAQVRPDLAVVLDTTYESEEQGVRLGWGPVLTLSDASVLLCPDTRDRLLDLMAKARVPLQTEVFNFSGTDARAFPQSGLTCPVLPLLVPTRGNHSPGETVDRGDLDVWPAALRAVAEQFIL
jgi:putative aminopeptidase FrvX